MLKMVSVVGRSPVSRFNARITVFFLTGRGAVVAFFYQAQGPPSTRPNAHGSTWLDPIHGANPP